MKLSGDLANVDWVRLAEVFRRAPLGTRDPAVLSESFQKSQVCCVAWDNDEIIGAGRAITDFVRCALILDVVVLPESQGKGVGTAIMAFLAERTKAPTIVLYAAPGKEGFYSRLGYRKMKTAMARFADVQVKQNAGYID